MALQAVQPEVACTGLGMLGVREAEVEVGAAVVGPGVQRGQRHQVDLVALHHDVLAVALAHPLRRDVAELAELAHGIAQAGETARQLGLEQVGDPRADVVETVDAERLGHPGLRAEHVHRQRQLGALDVLEQQRRAAGAHDPVDDLGDLEVRVDLRLDAHELAVLLEPVEELRQVCVGHGHQYRRSWTATADQAHTAIRERMERPSRRLP